MAKPKLNTIIIDDCQMSKKIEYKGKEWYSCENCEFLRRASIEDKRYKDARRIVSVCMMDGKPKYIDRRLKRDAHYYMVKFLEETKEAEDVGKSDTDDNR